MSHARSIKVWGLAFAAMFLISGLAAANASAAEWRLNGGAIGTAVPTEGSGTLKLTDASGGPFGESVTVECSGTTTGTAGPKITDTTSTVTVSGCVAITGVCKNPKVTAIHLPWKTELFESGGVWRDRIRSDGNGKPGYQVTCEFFGISATDTCESEAGQPKVTKLNTSPVPLEFDAGSGTSDCSRGGAGEGSVRGTVTVKSSSGTLTVG